MLGDAALEDEERHSGLLHQAERACTGGPRFAVERGTTSIVLDIHFENGGMVDHD
jgi:hypothetical protein